MPWRQMELTLRVLGTRLMGHVRGALVNFLGYVRVQVGWV